MKSKNHDADTRRWDTSRLPASDSMCALVDHAIQCVLEHEKRAGSRQRQRKAADMEAMRATVSVLVCDVVHRELTCPGEWISVPLSKRKLTAESRSRSPAFNRQLPALVETLAEAGAGFIELEKGRFRGASSTGSRIRASDVLKQGIADRSLTLADLRRVKPVDECPLVLRAAKPAPKIQGEKLPLPATAEVARFRADMDRINAWLAQADIQCDYTRKDGRVVDDSQRFLRRHFCNGVMNHGGRLFGGFWIDMPGKERLGAIMIDGWAVSECDFAQAGLRIAYSYAGQTPPTGDLYELPGVDPIHRPAIKRLIQALMASSTVPRRYPKGCGKLRKALRFEDLLEKVLEVHPPVRKLLGTSAWAPIQFTESQVLVRALLSLIDQGITALPIHDGLIVPDYAAAAAREAMTAAFLEETGLQGQVS